MMIIIINTVRLRIIKCSKTAADIFKSRPADTALNLLGLGFLGMLPAATAAYDTGVTVVELLGTAGVCCEAAVVDA